MSPGWKGGGTNTDLMNNAQLLLDILLAAAVLTTPSFRSAPGNDAAGLIAFIAPVADRSIARRPATLRVAMDKTKALEKRSLTYTVTASVYNAVPSQTDDEPFVTADNSRIKPHYGSKQHWMALSQDLLHHWGGKFKYGDKVRVRGISPKLDGVYTVHDTMNQRHHHCMDILTHPSEKYDIFQKDVKIQKVSI